MDPIAIKTSVRDFIRENFIFDNDYTLKDEISFMDHGIIDSTGILELVAFLEENYEIQVEDEELIPENLDSVNNIANYLQYKLNGSGAVTDSS